MHFGAFYFLAGCFFTAGAIFTKTDPAFGWLFMGALVATVAGALFEAVNSK